MSINEFVFAIGRDLRHTLRGFQSRTLFTLAAIVTLALGIGATTAIFTVVNGVLIKPLPYPDSNSVVTVNHSAVFGNVRGDSFPFSPQMLQIYQADGQSFEELGMYRPSQSAVTGEGDPEQVDTMLLTATTLWALGIQPALGRWFSADDDRPEAAETTILSNDYWQRRFGGNSNVIGRTITVDGRPREIIGVMPPRFTIREFPTDLILPMRWNLATPPPDFCCMALARLAPGFTVVDANSDVDRMLPTYLDRYMRPASGSQADSLQLRAAVRPLKNDVIGDIGQVLWVLLGSISILLVIACANVANLLLVRTETRSSEFAVRASLGAGFGHLARGLMVESLTLSLIGGLVGIGLAYAGLGVLLANPPANLPRLAEIAIDGQVVAFAFGISVGSGILFGLVPVLRVTGQRFSGVAAAAGGGRWASAGKSHQRLQNSLVVVQVSLALIMLVSSGLMIRTFQNLRSVEPGFADPASVQMARLPLPFSMTPDNMVQTQEQILDRLAALPGVRSAGYATSMPMELSTSAIVYPETETYANGELPPTRRITGISPGLLQTVGTPLLAGRDFDWVEVREQRDVALVSASFALETWGAVDAALGQRIRLGTDGGWQEVIGVVADVYDDGVDEPSPPTVYWPARQHPFVAGGSFLPNSVAFALRTERANTEGLIADIRGVVASITPELALTQIGTLEQIYRDHPSMARSAFSLVLLGIAGVVALSLSIVGIYGVLAYAVMQRRREVGIRVALGAAPRTVKRMFVYRGMALSGIGIVFGAIAAAWMTRLLSSLLFGVAPIDAPTFIVVAVILAAATLIASYIPARRATTIDPMESLRAE